MIRIIGIGSPFGDDAVGLEAARILADAPPPGCEVIAADRPGLALVDMLDGVEAAILVDAVCSGASPGTLHELDFEQIERGTIRFGSSHDLDVSAAIRLARALGRAPTRGLVIGVEIAPSQAQRPCGLSPCTQSALTRVVEQARACALALCVNERKRLILRGTVQGVGMRPFVWRLAGETAMAGFVRNAGAVVEIEIEGRHAGVAEFQRRLIRQTPNAAKIEALDVASVPLCGQKEFRVMPSERGRAAMTIPPDLATCADCSAEIADPASRRYRYPFTNCTSCGPRFTVVRAVPYERASTTMVEFALCDECQREYADPSDRRFQAEPIACPACGPAVWLEMANSEGSGTLPGKDCLERAAAIVRRGGVIAVHGLGGVHLACDGTNDSAVARLRAIKRRPHKPLAVMMDSVDSVSRLAFVSQEEAALLAAPAAPIVLLRTRPDGPLAYSVAPGNDHVGVMIAYSPLHRLLVRDAGRPLVMTSANRPGEPLVRDATEARALFDREVDALLLHNRPIHQRCDDSVWMVGPAGAQPIRLSRGNTPGSLPVSLIAPVPILAAGGDIKNSFCLLSGNIALMSQYIGTLENTATQEHFRDALQKWIALSGITPEIAAHDLHPESFARAAVEPLGLKMIGVQHHHAHVAACLAEHGYNGPAIGIAFDGAGYGTDGSIWGGEAMVADLCDFKRLSHLQSLPLAGGDAAVRHPARIAAGFLLALSDSTFRGRAEKLVGDETAAILATMIERGINTVPTSSCGRLFDAVGALLGICLQASYEAQAAIELEAIARKPRPGSRIYPCPVNEGIVSTLELLAAIVEDLECGTPIALIARAFHDTMTEVVSRMAADAHLQTGIRVVALSGGCFQNRLMLAGSKEKLERDGFTVLIHRRVPANDGGLALGQAVVAAAQLSSQELGGSPCVSAFRAA